MKHFYLFTITCFLVGCTSTNSKNPENKVQSQEEILIEADKEMYVISDDEFNNLINQQTPFFMGSYWGGMHINDFIDVTRYNYRKGKIQLDTINCEKHISNLLSGTYQDFCFKYKLYPAYDYWFNLEFNFTDEYQKNETILTGYWATIENVDHENDLNNILNLFKSKYGEPKMKKYYSESHVNWEDYEFSNDRFLISVAYTFSDEGKISISYSDKIIENAIKINKEKKDLEIEEMVKKGFEKAAKRDAENI